ncbi:MAG: hypothetical protein J6S71_09665 [Clostridia bacterium]|nr:hypothetical protein [Clostridia bacterium]
MSSAKGVRFILYLFERLVLSRFARMVICLRQNGYRLRRMVIRFAERRSISELRTEIFIFILKAGKFWSSFFKSLWGAGQRPANALQAVAALGDRLEGVKFPLAGNFRSFTLVR